MLDMEMKWYMVRFPVDAAGNGEDAKCLFRASISSRGTGGPIAIRDGVWMNRGVAWIGCFRPKALAPDAERFLHHF